MLINKMCCLLFNEVNVNGLISYWDMRISRWCHRWQTQYCGLQYFFCFYLFSFLLSFGHIHHGVVVTFTTEELLNIGLIGGQTFSPVLIHSSLHLPGFQLLPADHLSELLGKMRGGGICFCVNKGWFTRVTVLKKSCSPPLENHFTNYKRFYSPQEFSLFILVSVYIHPQACVSEVLQHQADQITKVKSKTIQTPCSLFWGILTEQTSAMNYQNPDSIYVPPGIQTFWTTAIL